MTPAPSSARRICAVVPEDAVAVLEAVAAQDHSPADLVRAPSVLRDGASRAANAGADWIWLLDGSAIPRADALQQLVSALDSIGDLPAPVLLSGKTLHANGALDLFQAPWYLRAEADLGMQAASLRLMPIRAARTGSVLVRVQSALRAGPPLRRLDAAGAGVEWTARVLRGAHGYLVAASAAVAAESVERRGPTDATGTSPAEDVSLGAAMLLSGAFGGRETLWLAPEVAGRARAALRSGEMSGPAVLRAGAAGIRSAIGVRRG